MLSKTNRSYLNVARYFATKSSSRNTHGAVIVKSGRVMATGWNKDRTIQQMFLPKTLRRIALFMQKKLQSELQGRIM